MDDARGRDTALAEALSYKKDGPVPPLWLYGGTDGAALGCLRPLTKDGATPAREFEMYSPDGTQVALITFRPGRLLPWPRRGRWTVRLGSGQKLVGKVGTWHAWTFWAILLPVWVPLWLVMFVYSLIEDGGWDSNSVKPKRVRWFGTDSAKALDRRGKSAFHLDPQRLDFRIAYAQALAADWE